MRGYLKKGLALLLTATLLVGSLVVIPSDTVYASDDITVDVVFRSYDKYQMGWDTYETQMTVPAGSTIQQMLDSQTLPEVADNGYIHTGWINADDNGSLEKVMQNGDKINLSATYEEYPVRINRKYLGEAPAMGEIMVPHGTTMEELAAMLAPASDLSEACQFLNWIIQETDIGDFAEKGVIDNCEDSTLDAYAEYAAYETTVTKITKNESGEAVFTQEKVILPAGTMLDSYATTYTAAQEDANVSEWYYYKAPSEEVSIFAHEIIVGAVYTDTTLAITNADYITWEGNEITEDYAFYINNADITVDIETSVEQAEADKLISFWGMTIASKDRVVQEEAEGKYYASKLTYDYSDYLIKATYPDGEVEFFIEAEGTYYTLPTSYNHAPVTWSGPCVWEGQVNPSMGQVYAVTAEYVNVNEQGFIIDGDVLVRYLGDATEVTIPEGIVTIGEDAFRYAPITSVVIPESVTTISDYAFYLCQDLAYVEMPSSVTSIGEQSFGSCYALGSITLSENLETIGNNAFDFCSSLTSIMIPASVNTIGDYAFEDCRNLVDVQISDGVTTIGEHAFNGCWALNTIVIPSSVTEIKKYAFNCCHSLERVYLDANITVLRECVFSECSSLKYITIPSTVTSIERFAFSFCDSLASITIPPTVTSFGGNICSENTSLFVKENSAAHQYAQSKGLTYYIYGDDFVIENGIVMQYTGSDAVVTIPDGVVGICEGAFAGCETITEVTIPATVTDIDLYAFANCINLTTVNMPDGKITTLENAVFSGCESLTNITIPETVTKIEAYAFSDCKSLSGIVVPASVEVIEYGAFSGCDSLASVTIPATVTTIDDNNAFSNNTVLYVTRDSEGHRYAVDNHHFYQILGEESDYVIENGVLMQYTGTHSTIAIPAGVTSIADSVFDRNTTITHVVVPNGVTSIGHGAFFDCTNLVSIVLPEGITSLGAQMFYACSALTSIELPTGITCIPNNMFNGCTSLKSVLVPEGVNTIEDYAFLGCTSLESINIPESMETIGNSVFTNCPKLMSITIPATVESIGEWAFSFETVLFVTTDSVAHTYAEEKGYTYYMPAEEGFVIEGGVLEAYTGDATEVVIPRGIKAIGKTAFKNNTTITSVIVPEGVTALQGDMASGGSFYGCKNLVSVSLPKTLERIEMGAFGDCTSLETLEIPESVNFIGQWVFYGYGLVKLPVVLHVMEDSYAHQHAVSNGYNYQFIVEEPGTFVVENGVLVQYIGTASKVIIPEGVTEIDSRVFYENEYVKKVIIPEGVTTIGEMTFMDCINLQTIEIPSSVANIGAFAFTGTQWLSDRQAENPLVIVNNRLIDGRTASGEVVIPYGVVEIGPHAFQSAGDITNVIIPYSVTRIGDLAFSNNYYLQNISIPTTLTEIGLNAFEDTSWLNTKRSENPLVIVNGILIDGKTAEGSVTIPYNVNEINQSAFEGSSAITQISIPMNVTKIGQAAFANCSNLQSAEVVGVDTVVEETAFYGCPNEFTLYCKTGSRAEQYAKDNWMNYVLTDLYTVTFHANGGVVYDGYGRPTNSFSIEMVEGESYATMPVAEKEGYVFRGWYTKPTGGDHVSKYNVVVGNTNLYAHWEKATYTITYYLNGGTQNSSNPTTYDIERATITLKNPTRKGYTFGGWYAEGSFKTKVTQITKGSIGNKKLFAKWSPIKYHITFDGNGADSGKVSSLKSCVYEENYKLPVNTFKKTGYVFVGWNTKADGSGKSYDDRAMVKNVSAIHGDKVKLYAQWKAGTYKIAFDGNGADSGTMSTIKATYGKKVTLSKNVFKKKGYTFVGWNTKADGSGKSYDNKEVVKNLIATNNKTVKLYAQWKANTYKIAFDGNGATSGKMSVIKVSYNQKKTLSKNVFKRTGYKFVGWNTQKDGSGKSYDDKEKIKNLTSTDGKTIKLFAQWKKVKYTITYVLNDGKNNKNNPSSYYVTTSTIKLKEPTRKGYTFQGWYTDKKFKNKITKITKGSTGNIKLYAKWKKNK